METKLEHDEIAFTATEAALMKRRAEKCYRIHGEILGRDNPSWVKRRGRREESSEDRRGSQPRCKPRHLPLAPKFKI